MPVSLFWDEEVPAVLRVTFCGRWTWEELREISPLIYETCLAEPGRTDVISDLSNAPYYPPRYEDGTNQLLATYRRAPNIVLAVLVQNPLQHSVFQSYAQRNPLELPYEFAPTVKAARELIRASRRGQPLPEHVLYTSFGN